MKIVNDGLRGDLEEPLEVLDALDECTIGPIVLQIANVLALAKESILPLRQTERVLQMCATGQDRRRAGYHQMDGQRDVAA